MGQMVLAKVFADLNWITSTANYQRSQHLSRMAQMRAALSSMGMPKIIINRVLRYTDFVNTPCQENRIDIRLPGTKFDCHFVDALGGY